ncbi:RNA-directed DNA polymerase, eukaryota, Nucleotide-binding alpha-beta plait domain protein [Artemisia annua]|uniref:RNA-directed DNA polymerase, eukaryota, Nucleotide-binding alpha-beta plait domain protein n=1 Tax=Artemisia annua TaxID=35608 RepID=A0A2U1PTW7_ARTAN|nr:RNA-directed DNA polymerase, eukaryota, Nucleotide-binding alpha-beta plait domain protein [Artemisia annua]
MRNRRSAPATEEWQQVPERRRERRERNEERPYTPEVTKFYVANLPDKCSSEDIKKVFGDYGVIAEVYVARKLNKYGQRFAFVNFSGVKNKQELEVRLRDLRMSEVRLFSTLAKFVDGKIMGRETNYGGGKETVKKDTGSEKSERNRARDNEEIPTKENNGGKGYSRTEGRSFRDMLINKNLNIQEVDLTIDPNTSAFPQWHNKAVVGRVHDFQRLIALRQWLLQKVDMEATIKYVGGLLVLVLFHKEEDAFAFSADEMCWKECFSKLSIWKGQILANERIAWLKIFGVPVCIVDNRVFNRIGGLFGVLMQPAQLSDDDGDLTYVCIGVLVGERDRINHTIAIRWRDKIIRVRVEEDRNDWIPDCLIPDDEESFNSDEDHNVNIGDDEDMEDRNDVVGDDESSDVCRGGDANSERAQKLENINDNNVELSNNRNVEDNGNFFQFTFNKRSGKSNEEVALKKYKKKCGRPRNSISPQVKNRPTKRARNGDPFSLNEMLGIIDSGPTSSQSSLNQSLTQNQEFITPDLNDNLPGINTGGLNSEQVIRGEENTMDIGVTKAGTDKEDNLVEEVNQTVAIGEALGVSNIGVTKAGTDKEDNLVEEVNQTVAIGEALGVSNIGNFINQGLRKEHDVGFVLFQESGYANVSESILESYWGYGDFGFDVVEPVGRSGGIVSMWDKRLFEPSDIIKHINFLLVSGELKWFGAVCNIINVYAPQRDVDKRLLWSELAALINSKVGLWVVAGDFNSVRSAEERRNSFFNHKAATEFNCFIEDTGLQEPSLKGSKFTFSTGNKLSRIDRIFVCWEFFNRWPDAEYRTLPKGRPDHRPIMLKSVSCNFGPKPSRFFNSWMERKYFEGIIRKVCEEFNFDGCPDVALMKKFKALRQAITRWKEDLKTKEMEEENVLQDDIELLEKVLEERDLSEEEQWIWKRVILGYEN